MTKPLILPHQAVLPRGYHKPDLPVINAAHPLSRGLVFYALMGGGAQSIPVDISQSCLLLKAGNATGAMSVVPSHHGGLATKLSGGANAFYQQAIATNNLGLLPSGSAPRSVNFWMKSTKAFNGLVVYWGPLGGSGDGTSWGVGSGQFFTDGISVDIANGARTFAGPGNVASQTSDGLWHNWTVIYPPGNPGIASHLVYCDGVAWTNIVQSAGVNTSLNTTATPGSFVIGNGYGFTSLLTASLEGLRIYNRALTVTEVRRLVVEPYAGILDYGPPWLYFTQHSAALFGRSATQAYGRLGLSAITNLSVLARSQVTARGNLTLAVGVKALADCVVFMRATAGGVVALSTHAVASIIGRGLLQCALNLFGKGTVLATGVGSLKGLWAGAGRALIAATSIAASTFTYAVTARTAITISGHSAGQWIARLGATITATTTAGLGLFKGTLALLGRGVEQAYAKSALLGSFAALGRSTAQVLGRGGFLAKTPGALYGFVVSTVFGRTTPASKVGIKAKTLTLTSAQPRASYGFSLASNLKTAVMARFSPLTSMTLALGGLIGSSARALGQLLAKVGAAGHGTSSTNARSSLLPKLGVSGAVVVSTKSGALTLPQFLMSSTITTAGALRGLWKGKVAVKGTSQAAVQTGGVSSLSISILAKASSLVRAAPKVAYGVRMAGAATAITQGGLVLIRRITIAGRAALTSQLLSILRAIPIPHLQAIFALQASKVPINLTGSKPPITAKYDVAGNPLLIGDVDE